MRLARRRAIAAGAAALVLTGCATPELLPWQPRVVDRLVIAPYASHEACASLASGDRLDYRFGSSAPLDFDIRYRDGIAVVAPLVREESKGDSGTFEAHTPQRYCLTWQAGAAGAVIDYRMMLRRGPG